MEVEGTACTDCLAMQDMQDNQRSIQLIAQITPRKTQWQTYIREWRAR